MFGLFRKRWDTSPKIFTGVGTVFVCDVVNVPTISGGLEPAQLANILGTHQDHIVLVVEKHRGRIIQFFGDAVLALWHPRHANHAQLAYDAARTAIQTLPKILRKQKLTSYSLRVALGTGEMAGGFFGPIQQYQIVGKAKTIADRLSSMPALAGSSIRMSQYTFDLLQAQEGIVQTGAISRTPLEELRVYGWSSVQAH